MNENQIQKNIVEVDHSSIDELITKFEQSSHKNEEGVEFWYARDLQVLLEYSQWRRFENIIDKAKDACESSKQQVLHHFANFGKIVKTGVATKEVVDYKLTRYACYLIAQNGDSRKQSIAFAQTYFAVQTRRQELEDLAIKNMSEDEKRIKLRNEIKGYNKSLSGVARKYGVVEPLDYAIFQNAGYRGLYAGESAKDIANRKGLHKKDDILDYMGSEELAANWFRVTQTEAQLKKDNQYGKSHANQTHHDVGVRVRNTMVNKPETLITPEENIKQLERKVKGGNDDLL